MTKLSLPAVAGMPNEVPMTNDERPQGYQRSAISRQLSVRRDRTLELKADR